DFRSPAIEGAAAPAALIAVVALVASAGLALFDLAMLDLAVSAAVSPDVSSEHAITAKRNTLQGVSLKILFIGSSPMRRSCSEVLCSAIFFEHSPCSHIVPSMNLTRQ